MDEQVCGQNENGRHEKNMENDELEKLLIRHDDGLLTDAEIKRLREILKASPQARQKYAQWQSITYALKLESEFGYVGEEASLESHFVQSSRATPESRWGTIWATVATVLFLCAAGYLFVNQFRDGDSGVSVADMNGDGADSVVSEPTSDGVAILTKLVDVTWDDPSENLEEGASLKPGKFKIQKGLAQIEFFCGATLILEGPAEIEFQSDWAAKVINGKLRANVPEVAKGFTLEVDEIKVVDLGTEFGLAVADGKTDVQVFEGEVELHTGNENKQSVLAGNAVTRKPDGSIETASIDPQLFVTMAELESRKQDQTTVKIKHWSSWAEKMKSNPDVVAFYSFDQPGDWQRKLPCACNSLFDQSGAIVGARKVMGRWGNKSGLVFKQPGDRVRMKIPGEFGSLTFAAWVKIDSLDRMYNSLFLTDNYNHGEPHWQILESGQLFFSVRWRPDDWVRGKSPNGPAHYPVVSAPFWKPSMSGKWIHLATTFDVETSVVTHYVDGQAIHEERIPDSLMVKTTRIGEATLGNWSLPTRADSRFAIRNLNGTMDELLILKTALKPVDIAEIWQIGKPN